MSIHRTLVDHTDTTSATLTDLIFDTPPVVVSGRMYHFRAVLPFDSAAATTGLGVAVANGLTATRFEASANAPVSTTAGASAMETDATVTPGEQMTFSAVPATAGAKVVVEGHIKPSTTGELKISVNTEVNASQVRVWAGAHMRLTDMGAV